MEYPVAWEPYAKEISVSPLLEGDFGGDVEEEEIQEAAVEALGRLGGLRAFEALGSVLAWPTPRYSLRPTMHGGTIQAIVLIGQAGYLIEAARVLDDFTRNQPSHNLADPARVALRQLAESP